MIVSRPVRLMTPAALTPGGRPAWMLTRAALGQVATEPAVLAGLRRAPGLEILHPRQKPPAVGRAPPPGAFSSVSDLAPAGFRGPPPARPPAPPFHPGAPS